MITLADPSAACVTAHLSSRGAGLFAAGSYSSRVFYTTHGSPFSAALNAFASFSAATASCVYARLRKVVRAARAQVLCVFAMPALSAVCHW